MRKLKDYEDAGLTPEEAERVNDFEQSETGKLLKVLGEERKKHAWIPADEPPETDEYILLSFGNFNLPLVGRYEQNEDGTGNFYLGDCDEEDTCLANDLYVNAWMPLPKCYREEDNA